ncbi:MAG: alpha/beta fold hydrolase [Acidimicrobiia bacterium]
MSPTVAFSHATSFCGAVWNPVVEQIEGEHLVWDHLGHGHAQPIPRPFDWWKFGADVVKRVSSVDGPLLGVGHSMGGTALVMAELLAPGTFDYLVLIEPILLPPPFAPRDNHVARSAVKRRSTFPSLIEARNHLRRKPPFMSWDDRAFDGYLRDGFRLTGRGTEVTLSCAPDVEAEIYRAAFAHGAWARLGEVTVPTLVIAGALSDTHEEALVRELASRFPSAGFEIVAGVGHFLPMERPRLVADRVRRLGALQAPEDPIEDDPHAEENPVDQM